MEMLFLNQKSNDLHFGAMKDARGTGFSLRGGASDVGDGVQH